MSLLAVLLTVILQYFAEHNDFLSIPDGWVAKYWQLISSYLVNVGWRIGVVAVVLPVLFALFLIRMLSTYLLHGLLDFAILLLVLLITLRVRNYTHLFAPYTQALAAQDWDSGAQIVSDLAGGVQADGFVQANQQLGRWVSVDLFRNWFVGLFWFGVLGIYGITAYWLWRRLAIELNKADDQIKLEYLDGLYRCLYWAEYLPARLWTAGYALVGEFVPTFDWLMKELWSNLPSDQMIVHGSLLALGRVSVASETVDVKDNGAEKGSGAETSVSDSLLELQQTVRLNSRLFVIWFILLIFSGVWASLM